MSKTKELTADAELERLKTLIGVTYAYMNRVESMAKSASECPAIEATDVVHHLTIAVNAIDDARDGIIELVKLIEDAAKLKAEAE